MTSVKSLMGVDENGVPIMRALERMVLLKMVDSKWMDHIDAMEELKRGIGLRSTVSRDPLLRSDRRATISSTR